MAKKIKDNDIRLLEKIAFHHWIHDKSRSSEENWNYALKVLAYIKKRLFLVQKLLTRSK